MSDSLEPGYKHARVRRTLLVTSVVAGVLTAGATLAGNLVNMLSGTAALVFTVTGAVLAGSAAVVTVLVAAPTSPPQAAPTSPPPAAPQAAAAPRRARTVPGGRWRRGLHPLAAIRGLRYPVALLLLAIGPWHLDNISVLGLEKDTAKVWLMSILVVTGVALAIAARLVNQIEMTITGAMLRGAGLDAVLAYTAATCLGVWQGAITHPGWGLITAGFTLILVAFVASALEDDTYAHGPAPLLLASTGAAAAVASVGLADVDWMWSAPVAVVAATCVVLPAMIRGHSASPPAGLIEFVPLVVCMVLGLTLHWAWIVVGAAVFLAAIIYAWRHPQPRIARHDPPLLFLWFPPMSLVILLELVLIALLLIATCLPLIDWLIDAISGIVKSLFG